MVKSYRIDWRLAPVSTYQCSNVGIGLLVQQKLGDSIVATVSGHVQRCEVVQCDIVNRRLVLQQEFNALYVVSLGRHVQRRQSVLYEDKSDKVTNRCKWSKKAEIEDGLKFLIGIHYLGSG